MGGTNTPWPAEREQILRYLWNDEGLSQSIIAARMGISVSAVAGKLKRLGEQRKYKEPPSARPSSDRRKPSASRPTFRFVRCQGPAAPRRPVRAKRPADHAQHVQSVTSVGPFSVYLTAGFFDGTLALREGMCRWPYGDPKRNIAYCGRAAEGSYCGHHACRAFRGWEKYLQ